MTPHDLLGNFETLAEAPNGIQRLRELVLELAVRGKLVEQDPGDEPASELLKRAKDPKSKLSGSGRQGRSVSTPATTEASFDLPLGWLSTTWISSMAHWLYFQTEKRALTVTKGG